MCIVDQEMQQPTNCHIHFHFIRFDIHFIRIHMHFNNNLLPVSKLKTESRHCSITPSPSSMTCKLRHNFIILLFRRQCFRWRSLRLRISRALIFQLLHNSRCLFSLYAHKNKLHMQFIWVVKRAQKLGENC